MKSEAHTSRRLVQNKWFRLGGTVVLAVILSLIVLLIPVTRNISRQTEGNVVAFTLPFGAQIVQAANGLTITKSAFPSPDVDQGERLTYTLTIFNNTGQDLTDVIVSDTVPDNTQCIGGSLDGAPQPWLVPTDPNECQNSGVARWLLSRAFGDVFSNNTVATLTYGVLVSEPLIDQSIIDNTGYEVTAENITDTQSFNDVGTIPITTLVNAPNWQISKSVSPTPTVEPGQSLVYTINITNNGHLTTEGAYTITEQIPNFTDFVTSSPPTTPNGSTLTWVLTDPLDIDETFALSFTVRVTDTGQLLDGTPIVNQTYSITGGNVFSQADGAPIIVTLNTPVTMTLVKEADPEPVPAGDTLLYTITVTNGPASKGPAEDVVVTDTIPADTTLLNAGFVGGSLGTVTTSPLTVTWRITSPNPIPVGDTVTMTMLVQVDSPLPSGTLILNNYEATTSNDFTLITDPPVVTTTVVSTPTLNINKTADPPSVEAGDLLTYTITFSNTGNADATNVVVTDTLSSLVSYTSSVPPGTHDGSPFGGVITWNIGPVAGEGAGSGILTVTVVVSSPLPVNSFVNNTVVIGAAEGVTESKTITTPVNSLPDLEIAKTVSPTPTVEAGELLTYTLTVSNVGNANALNVVVSDTIPLSTTFVDATPGFTPPPPLPGTPITWPIASLGVATPQVFTFVVRVDPIIPNGTEITNTATISSDLDFETSDTVTTTVESAPVLEIFKDGEPDVVAAGGILTYTIVYTNSGSDIATNVVISDQFPLNTSYNSDSSNPNVSPGTLVAGGIEWTIPTLAAGSAGGVITLTLNVGTPQDAGTILTNEVTITATEPTIDIYTATNTITSTPNLQVSKAASADPIKAGRELIYTITYTNTGNMNATGVVITDTYDGPFVSISAPGAVVQPAPPPARITWNIPNVPADSTPRTQVFTVTLPDSLVDGTVLTNSVIINSAQDSTDSDSITTTVRALEADLSILKTRVGSGVVVSGNPITYTLTITNNGPDTIEAVITDTFTNARYQSHAIAPPYSGAPCSTPAIGPFNCTISALTGTTNITLVLDTSLSISGTVGNSATITPTKNALETDDTDNSSSAPDVTVRYPEVDLSVDKTRDGSGGIIIGQPITYFLTVQNTEPDPVTAILTDTFTNASFGSATILPPYPGGSCSSLPPGPIICTFPNFASNSRLIRVILNTTNSVSGTISNSAEISSTTTVVELDPSDNTDSAPDVSVRAPIADLTIVKARVGAGTVVIDGPITYTLTITNNGPDTVTAIITDTFTNASFGSVSIAPPYSGAPCTPGAGQFICTINNFTNSTTITVILDTSTSVAGVAVTNSAEIGSTSDVVEPTPGDNNSTGPNVDVRLPTADLQIAKGTILTEVADGSLITYTVVVTNDGPDVVDAVVTDTFDTGKLSIVSCDGCSGTGPLTWVLTDFIGTRTFNLVLQAAFGISETVTNQVEIGFDRFGSDNNPANDSDSADVFVRFVQKFLYLPLILKNFPPPPPTPTATPTESPTSTPTGPTATPTATPTGPPPPPPDLIITDFFITPASPTSSDNVIVTVIIKNQGGVSTGEGFWTDFYVNPKVLPNDPSLTTGDRGWFNSVISSTKGIAWRIDTPLGPGESRTLTSDGSGGGLAPAGDQTDWDAPQLTGGNYMLYAFVDSFDDDDPTGPTNVEVVESNEDNNLSGPIIVNVVGGSANEVDSAEAPRPIKPRPDIGRK